MNVTHTRIGRPCAEKRSSALSAADTAHACLCGGTGIAKARSLPAAVSPMSHVFETNIDRAARLPRPVAGAGQDLKALPATL